MKKILLGLLVLCFVNLVSFGQTDSLGIEKDGTQYFVIHKVMAGQTLYSLAKRYGTNVTDIRNKNSELANGLQVGQTLKIPYGKPFFEASNNTNLNADTEAKFHSVAAGETLFSISKQYNISIDEIKRMNGLTSNALAVGKVLKVGEKPANHLQKEKPMDTISKPIEETPAQENTSAKKEESVAVNDTKTTPLDTVKKETTEIALAKEVTTETYNGTPFEEVIEEGQAELIDEDQPSTKFLALHKTAKAGTVIKVRNRMNDLTVYVRVVGEIPATTDNENIIIKLNKRAYDQLKALDKRFLVELSYFQ